MSQGNSRTNGISDRKSHGHANCEHHGDTGHSLNYPVVSSDYNDSGIEDCRPVAWQRLLIKQSAGGVATSREGHRSPRSGRAGQHRRWGQGRKPLRIAPPGRYLFGTKLFQRRPRFGNVWNLLRTSALCGHWRHLVGYRAGCPDGHPRHHSIATPIDLKSIALRCYHFPFILVDDGQRDKATTRLY